MVTTPAEFWSASERFCACWLSSRSRVMTVIDCAASAADSPDLVTPAGRRVANPTSTAPSPAALTVTEGNSVTGSAA
ncbi:hypothetical protein D3C87_1512000 [compost metagenome]